MEQRFGGDAFTAEKYVRRGSPVYDVELLIGRRIVEAVFDANTGALLSSENYSTPRRAAELRLRNNRFLVEVRARRWLYDVLIDSTDGRVIFVGR